MSSTEDQIDLLVGGARYGDLEDVQSALEQGISPDLADDQGRTGSICACTRQAAPLAVPDIQTMQDCTWRAQTGTWK